MMLENSLWTSSVTLTFQIKVSKKKFSGIFKISTRPVFQEKAPMTFFVSYSSLTILKFTNLNFENSSISWYFHLKLQIQTRTSNRNFQHQLGTSNLQERALCILTITYVSIGLHLLESCIFLSTQFFYEVK